MIQKTTLSLAFAIIVSSASAGFSQISPNHIYSADVHFSHGKYTVHHVFDAGIVVEVIAQNGKAVHKSRGKYKLSGDAIEIEWKSGAKERATVTKTNVGLKYRITAHTDKTQVGMVLNYRKSMRFRQVPKSTPIPNTNTKLLRRIHELEDAARWEKVIRDLEKIGDIWAR